MVVTEFCGVLSGFTGFYRVLPSFTGEEGPAGAVQRRRRAERRRATKKVEVVGRGRLSGVRWLLGAGRRFVSFRLFVCFRCLPSASAGIRSIPSIASIADPLRCVFFCQLLLLLLLLL